MITSQHTFKNRINIMSNSNNSSHTNNLILLPFDNSQIPLQLISSHKQQIILKKKSTKNESTNNNLIKKERKKKIQKEKPPSKIKKGKRTKLTQEIDTLQLFEDQQIFHVTPITMELKFQKSNLKPPIINQFRFFKTAQSFYQDQQKRLKQQKQQKQQHVQSLVSQAPVQNKKEQPNELSDLISLLDQNGSQQNNNQNHAQLDNIYNQVKSKSNGQTKKQIKINKLIQQNNINKSENKKKSTDQKINKNNRNIAQSEQDINLQSNHQIIQKKQKKKKPLFNQQKIIIEKPTLIMNNFNSQFQIKNKQNQSLSNHQTHNLYSQFITQKDPKKQKYLQNGQTIQFNDFQSQIFDDQQYSDQFQNSRFNQISPPQYNQFVQQQPTTNFNKNKFKNLKQHDNIKKQLTEDENDGKKSRKLRVTITHQKLMEMNKIFNQYGKQKQQGLNPAINLKAIGVKLDLGYSTILHKYRQFRNTKKVKGGALLASLQKKRKYKKSLQIQKIISKALQKKSFYTAVQLSQYIYVNFGKKYSRSIISRHLGQMGYSYKNLKNSPNQCNKAKYKQPRRQYCTILSNIIQQPNTVIIFLDEIVFNVTACLKKKNLATNKWDITNTQDINFDQAGGFYQSAMILNSEDVNQTNPKSAFNQKFWINQLISTSNNFPRAKFLSKFDKQNKKNIIGPILAMQRFMLWKIYSQRQKTNEFNQFQKLLDLQKKYISDKTSTDPKDYVSGMVTMFKQGILMFQVKQGFFEKRNFIDHVKMVIDIMKQKHIYNPIQQNLVLVTDMCRIHYDSDNPQQVGLINFDPTKIDQFCIQNKIRQIFLPPMSSNLNPFMQMFSSLKNRIGKENIKSSIHLRDQLFEMLYQYKQIISCDLYFSDMLQNLQRGRRSLDFV